jgi:hypothetical protein
VRINSLEWQYPGGFGLNIKNFSLSAIILFAFLASFSGTATVDAPSWDERGLAGDSIDAESTTRIDETEVVNDEQDEALWPGESIPISCPGWQPCRR